MLVNSFSKYIFSFLFCALGGYLISCLNFPLSFMFGSMFTVVLLKRFRFHVAAPKHSITFIQLALGISVGLMFKDIMFESVHTFIELIAFLLLCLSCQFLFSYFWLYKKAKWTNGLYLKNRTEDNRLIVK